MASVALISLAEYRNQKALADDDIADAQISMAIDQASRLLVEYCGREFLRGNTSDLFKGNGSYRYYATHCRILAENASESIEAPTLYYYAGTQSGTNWEESERSWEFDTEKGFIWFTDPFDTFYTSSHRFNWRLDYYYGWKLADIPASIKYACARMTHLILKQMEHDGMSSQSFAGGTTAYALALLPNDLKTVLNAYRSPRLFEC